MSTANIDHWSRYWQTGHLTSLPEDFAVVYDGEIEAFWADVAADLPAGAKVLDVCAGNGPVALLIARHAAEAKVWAADAAAIEPESALARHPALRDLAERVTFLPDTPTERIGAVGERFDLVTSQYGIEYTDWEASANAVFDALEPGGRLAIVAHVPTSAMVETMEEEQREYAQLDEIGVPAALLEFGARGNGSTRKRLKRGLIRLRMSAPRTSALLISVLHGAEALLAMPEAQLRSQLPAIRQYARDLVAGRDRAADLLETNRRILENPRWFDVFSEAGLELISEQQLLYGGQHVCGLALLFRKPVD